MRTCLYIHHKIKPASASIWEPQTKSQAEREASKRQMER